MKKTTKIMKKTTTKSLKAFKYVFNVRLPIILMSLIFSVFISGNIYGQCTNTSNSYINTVAPTSGSVTIPNTLTKYYNKVTGIVNGTTYQTSSTVSSDYITIRKTSFSGAVVAHGLQPLTWTANSAGDYFIHVNLNSSCGQSSSNSDKRNLTLSVVGGSGGDTECTTLLFENFDPLTTANWTGTVGVYSYSSGSGTSSGGCTGNSWKATKSSMIITTKTLNIPATGDSKLSFDYSCSSSSNPPQVYAKRSSTSTLLKTLGYQYHSHGCKEEEVSLNAYKGQAITIYFKTMSTSTFILDNVKVKNCPEAVEDPVDPTFSFATTYCQGDISVSGYTLPTTSTNGIPGTWSPSRLYAGSLEVGTVKNYTFTPNSGENANPVTIPVTVYATPSASISGTSPICSGSSTTLTASGSGGTGSYSYKWNTNATSTSIAPSPSSSTTYTVTVTDGNGCKGDASKYITVNSKPIVSISGNTSICDGSSTTLTANGSGGSGSSYSYKWNTNAQTASITTPVLSANTSYNVTVTDGNTCTGTTSKTVTVNPILTPTFGFTTEYYLNATADVLPNTSINSISGTWNPSAIATGVVGSSNYVFTPNVGECANGVTISVTINPNPYWTGAISSDWNNAGNWSNGLVPTEPMSILIPEGYINPLIINNDKTSPAICANLTIESGAVLTIAANKALTVNGDLDNNGTIYIESTVSGDGSLLLGSISGTGTYNVGRYLEGNMWHLVTSPITTGLSGVFEDIWLRAYVESTNTFGEYIVPTNTPMTSGQGFSVWAPTSEIRTFSGTINQGNVGPLSVQLTGVAGTEQGWNLMGNPYTSAIDWDAASGWTKNNLANAVYVWNNNQYATYINGASTNGGSRYISSGQGFFVQAIDAGASLKMTNDIRLHNGVSFLKENSDPSDIIRIQIFGNDCSDESVIAVREGSSSNFDPMTDAVKLTGSNLAPQMHTTKEDLSQLSINCVNSMNDVFGKAVYVNYAQDGEHVISWSHTFAQATIPVLYDNLTATAIQAGIPYTFSASSTDPAERFTFAQIPLGIDDNQTSINVWENNNIVYVQNLTAKPIKDVCVYNMQGQLVMKFNSNVKDLSSLSPAVYVVKVNAGENSVIEKVIIK